MSSGGNVERNQASETRTLGPHTVYNLWHSAKATPAEHAVIATILSAFLKYLDNALLTVLPLDYAIMSSFRCNVDGFLHQHSLRLPTPLRAALFRAHEQPCTPSTFGTRRSLTSAVVRRSEYHYKSNVAQRSSAFVNHDPVLRQVVQSRQPVTIYRAPKNRWYYARVYGVAALWIGVGAYSIKFNDDIKEQDLAFFVRPTYIGVGLGFIAIGCYVCTAPTNRMRALAVMPSLQGGPMQLRMSVRAAPWTRERTIFSNLGGATISEKTEPMVQELLEAERARRQRVFTDLEHLSILGRVWEGSARWVHQKWTSFFLRFKFAVLRFGIAEVDVQGEKWKIDCSGWLLENGRGTSIAALTQFSHSCWTAIDRIIPED